jgi:hypothetical protein
LSYRNPAEARRLADEPEAVQEALRLQRPGWPLKIVDYGEVLCEGFQVGVIAITSSGYRLPYDCLRPGAIVGSQRELVEELAHSVAEVLALAGTISHAGKRLAQPLGWRWV